MTEPFLGANFQSQTGRGLLFTTEKLHNHSCNAPKSFNPIKHINQLFKYSFTEFKVWFGSKLLNTDLHYD
jgi:hypothetical protein